MKITLFWEEAENKPDTNYIAVSGKKKKKKKRKMLLEKADEDEVCF